MAADHRIVRVDPYHAQLGALAHMVAQRLSEDAKKLGDDTDFTLTNIFSRLWAMDPTVLVLASLDPKSGQLVGYTVVSIEAGQAFIMQPRFDRPSENDATGEMLGIAENWVKDYNTAMGLVGGLPVSKLILVARRFDAKWEKKYGFETKRYLLEKPIGE